MKNKKIEFEKLSFEEKIESLNKLLFDKIEKFKEFSEKDKSLNVQLATTNAIIKVAQVLVSLLGISKENKENREKLEKIKIFIDKNDERD